MLPRKILLAADDSDDRELFRLYAAARPVPGLVHVAENGAEVIELLSDGLTGTGLPDVIVLDQNMPRKNGIETLAELKRSPAFRAIPVFIYSTYASEALRVQCLQLGALSVFQKPDSPEAYQYIIDGILRLIS
ncbi:response regulator [Flaviaesturariibacter amylovorans]|uniref:Response regulator n=1 Tax=Flaviaesturariibacter amylovorans TaxID=1084520 RepID=A0ABP8GFZ7_9BACT